MSKRKIIKIDEKKCNGCGLCLPNCPEGALQIIDQKARLISDLFCDGLGACIGHCPEGAITIEEREAEQYNEKRVMENVVTQGKNVIKAHLEHLREHGETQYLKEALEYLKENNIEVPAEFEKKHAAHQAAGALGGCPGSRMMDFGSEKNTATATDLKAIPSELRQWPLQIHLVPVHAPYFKDADLLIAADCVPFALGDFHSRLLKGKVLLIGCPKLDDLEVYAQKISQILKENDIKSLTCAHMEVPCCFGLLHIIKQAIESSGKDIPFNEVTVGIKGDVK